MATRPRPPTRPRLRKAMAVNTNRKSPTRSLSGPAAPPRTLLILLAMTIRT